MASPDIQASLGQALVGFSRDGRFPDDELVSAASADDSVLPGALAALSDAQSALETEIRQISYETAPDVEQWITHAKTIQDDIEKSRRLANSIVRQAEANEQRLEALEEQENYVTFLMKETAFNQRLGDTLRSIQQVKDQLDRALEFAGERNFIQAMVVLEDSYAAISQIPADNMVRAWKILDAKWADLRGLVQEQVRDVWNLLIHVDMDKRVLTINKTLPDEVMSLEQVMIGLKTYKEVDSVAKKLWEDLDDAILKPRSELRTGNLLSIQIEGNTISARQGHSDTTIKSLFFDLEKVIRFLIENLPPDLIKSLSDVMMPTLSTRIKELWLDTAVPSSLDDMVDYQKALLQVSDFAKKLDDIQWPGTGVFHDWVANVSKIWLNKRRETALDWTRHQLSLGVGIPRSAERVEKRMVPRDEGQHIAATGTVATEDWDAAWDSDQEGVQEDSGRPELSKNRGSVEEERRNSVIATQINLEEPQEEDDAADAWGWGDDDDDDAAAEAEPVPENNPISPRSETEPAVAKGGPLVEKLTADVREMTLSEKYSTSSIPQPVLHTVTALYDDCATLTKPENEQLPVAPAAPGLFNLPTLILAMYRAVSPYYYASDPNGNMYLYNDAMWLADRLRDFTSEWKQRKDLTERAYGLVKLDPEVKKLESFGKRAYTNELINQRTVLIDLLGDTQNFLQQDRKEITLGISNIVEQTRDKAKAWSQILTWSACASAVGSLVNTIATKLIADIFDLPTIGVDDAESIATVLTKVEELDDLFIKPTDPKSSDSNPSRDEVSPKVSLAAQFVDKWLRMNYLNQILQSNLADIKFLWNESELSYYFTAEEVVDLINLSFENNNNVRQTIKEIRANPNPRDSGEEW